MKRLSLFAVLATTALLGTLGCQKAESPKKEADAAKESKATASQTPPGSAARLQESPTAGAPVKTPPSEAEPMTAVEVLDRMVVAYRTATSYADVGTARLLAEAGPQKIEQTVDFSATLVRPNKLRLQAYQAMLVCDGQKIHAAIEDAYFADQVLLKPAPPQMTLPTIFADRFLASALSNGFAGPLPQLVLLLGDDPTKDLLRDAKTPELAEPAQIDGRNCHRVEIARPDGTAVFWIDQESFVLRRITLPTDELREQLQRELGQDKPLGTLSLVAEFTGAKIGGAVDPKAFAFEIPEGAEVVTFFLPPDPGQLLSKKVPNFKFFDLDGKEVTAPSLAGKIVVLDFWATWCGPCRASLPSLEKVYEKYKSNDKVAFYAVSIDQPSVENKDVVKMFEDLKVNVPILRDPEQSALPFKFPGIPTSFIVGADGTVQDYEGGVDAKLVDVLSEKLDKLLAGADIYQAPLKEYQERLQKYAEMARQEEAAEGDAGQPAGEVRELPQAEMAARSEPTTLKLAPLWKCNELKAPGNILVLQGKAEPPRLLVVDSWQSVAEVGLDGKVIGVHKLNLGGEQMEVVSSLRAFTAKDGKPYIIAFASAQQRLHLLDENWKHLLSYPENALEKPHSGIADVEVAELNGDGVPQICVGYWGAVGVQGVSLDGTRLWSNRSVENVLRMAVGAPDEQGRRRLVCTNNTGSLVMLDGNGERQGEITIPNHTLFWLVAADLQGDGQPLWCALTAPKLGDNIAVGISLKGEELWEYTVPAGVQPAPIEPIIAGKVTPEGPGQWILPGPDGSIHILSADGKLLDKFNYGETLQGLTTVEIDGQPALVIASSAGLEALKVER